MPQRVQVLKVKSKTGTMQLGVFWPSDIVERVKGWTHSHGMQEFCGIWRDDEHGNPMGTMSGDDVDSTKLITASEVDNSNTTFRKEQLRDTCSGGLFFFGDEIEDHELENGTQAPVPLSAGRHLAARPAFGFRFFDRLGGRSMPGPLCGFVEEGRNDAQRIHMIKNKSEKSSVQFARAHKHCPQYWTHLFQHAHLRLRLSRRVQKNELGQRRVSINFAAGNHPGRALSAGEGCEGIKILSTQKVAIVTRKTMEEGTRDIEWHALASTRSPNPSRN